MICPRCSNEKVYKSRSHNFFEKVLTKFLNQKFYRCHKCGWRGLLKFDTASFFKDKVQVLAIFLSVFFALILGLLLLRYLNK